ncbi:MAG: hypothetical protein ACR2H6_08165 [Pyrinomonadaceae bacterium]
MANRFYIPSPKAMKRFHLIFGGVMILIFILTGQYIGQVPAASRRHT